jgi:hypothetical protein
MVQGQRAEPEALVAIVTEVLAAEPIHWVDLVAELVLA